MKSILIVEDNEAIIKGLKYLLEQENFDVTICKTAEDTMNVVGTKTLDLIILDITLPDGNGYELCEYIKKYTDIPIIFLTARDEEQDVVKGLDMGAEDYIIKPFRNKELLSRINNVLKRFNKENNKIIYENIEIDLDQKIVYIEGTDIELTALEFKILVLLFSNIGKVVTREQILEKIWDVVGNFVNDNTLTVYIKRIRNKIPDVVFSTDIIVGFPGETEEDFEDTIDVVKQVNFEQIFMFIYSRRVGTRADKMENQISEEIKHKRFDRLKQVFEESVEENNKKYVGTTQKILVEGHSKNNQDMLTGRTDTNKVVVFEGPEELIGKIINIKIVSEHKWYLKGEV